MALVTPTTTKTGQEQSDWLHDFCQEQFGPDGASSKQFAEQQGGNAMFDAFMAEMNKVDDSNKHKAKIIERALARRYHDLEGDLMTFGMVMDLRAAGLDDLASRGMQGEFDF